MFWPKPGNDFHCSGEYVAHDLNLVVSLGDVLLIDAWLVDLDILIRFCPDGVDGIVVVFDKKH